MDAFQRLEAERARLIDIALEQDILRRNVEGTAKWVVEKVLAENAVGRFEALRAEQDRWYKRGRDKGLNFDLEVSVHLVRAALDHATDADKRGNGQNDLGATLGILGDRRGDEDLLEQAVTVYRLAIVEWTRDRVPLDWAKAQNNLGTALKRLGKRRGSEDLLEQAVTALRAALVERPKDRLPLDWANTQNTLGAALATLGERRDSEDLLQQAITAFRAARTEQSEVNVPLAWAMTTANISILELMIYRKTAETAHLNAAYEAASAADQVFRKHNAIAYIEHISPTLDEINRRLSAASP